LSRQACSPLPLVLGLSEVLADLAWAIGATVRSGALARGERGVGILRKWRTIALHHGQRELHRQCTEEATHGKPGFDTDPSPGTTKALADHAIYQGLQMVAGVGFEPTTRVMSAVRTC
jgi:hypothetical protein